MKCFIAYINWKNNQRKSYQYEIILKKNEKFDIVRLANDVALGRLPAHIDDVPSACPGVSLWQFSLEYQARGCKFLKSQVSLLESSRA